MKVSEKQLKELGVTLGAVAAGYLMKKALEGGYRRVFDEEPPNAVKDEEINWGKVLGWTIVSGIAATALKVAIKRFGGQNLDE